MNPIRYNATPGLDFESPHPDIIHQFAERLRKANINTTLRESRGTDTLSPCGQLHSHTESKA